MLWSNFGLRLNTKYYGYKLQRVRFMSRAFDILIAIGTTGTGIAAWGVWELPAWKVSLDDLSGLATLLAIVRPMLDLTKRSEQYATLFTAHQQNFQRLRRVPCGIPGFSTVDNRNEIGD